MLFLETITFEEDEDKPNKHSLYYPVQTDTTESSLAQALEQIVYIRRERTEHGEPGSHGGSDNDSEITIIESKLSNSEESSYLSKFF